MKKILLILLLCVIVNSVSDIFNKLNNFTIHSAYLLKKGLICHSSKEFLHIGLALELPIPYFCQSSDG